MGQLSSVFPPPLSGKTRTLLPPKHLSPSELHSGAQVQLLLGATTTPTLGEYLRSPRKLQGLMDGPWMCLTDPGVTVHLNTGRRLLTSCLQNSGE